MQEQLMKEAKSNGLRQLIKMMLNMMTRDPEKENEGAAEESAEHLVSKAEGEEIAADHHEVDPSYYTKESAIAPKRDVNDVDGEPVDNPPDDLEGEKKKFMKGGLRPSAKKGISVVISKKQEKPSYVQNYSKKGK